MYMYVSMYMFSCMHVPEPVFMSLFSCVCECKCAFVWKDVCTHGGLLGGLVLQNCEEYTKRDKNKLTGKLKISFVSSKKVVFFAINH